MRSKTANGRQGVHCDVSFHATRGSAAAFGRMRMHWINALRILALCLVGMLGSGLAAAQIHPDSGIWWNPNESGRGFFIDTDAPKNGVPTVAALAGFIYDGGGTPIWFIASGPLQGDTLTAEMRTYRGGQTLAGTYSAPGQGPSLGSLTLHFTSATTATLNWPGGSEQIKRFGIGPDGLVIARPSNSLVRTGIWWNPAESGRGFTVEQQGTTLIVAGYMYDSFGNPAWYIASAPLHEDGNGLDFFAATSSGTWQQYASGQPLGAAYSPAQIAHTIVGDYTFSFSLVNGFVDASVVVPDRRVVVLEKFFCVAPAALSVDGRHCLIPF